MKRAKVTQRKRVKIGQAHNPLSSPFRFFNVNLCKFTYKYFLSFNVYEDNFINPLLPDLY